MNKTKLLGILVGLLVLLNVIILSFFLVGRKGDHPPQRPPHPDMLSQRIIKSFDFNQDQVKLFELSKAKHMEESKMLFDDLEQASLAYYNTETEATVKDSLYSKVATITKEIYLANSIHFDEVRKICTPSQLPHMDSFIKALLGNKGPREKRRK